MVAFPPVFRASAAAGVVRLGLCSLLVADDFSSHALDNGAALTPMMGWNSWYAGGQVMNETALMLQADLLVDSGLRKVGFRYFNLDDGVIAPRCASYTPPCKRSAASSPAHQQADVERHPPPPTGGRLKNGSLWADPFRFSNGSLGALSAYVHDHGLLFGVYTARGRATCEGLAGSLGNEWEDARRFVKDWDADYVKEDSCHGVPNDPPGSASGSAAIAQYRNMSDALNATGKHVVLDACWYTCYPANQCPGTVPLQMDNRVKVANSWRVGMDGSSFGRAIQNINIGVRLSQWAGPGHWNNLGLMSFGKQTPAQNRVQFSVYSILASPLILSGDLKALRAADLQTYGNAAVVAVSQDKLGSQGKALSGFPLCGDGSPNCTHTGVIGKRLADQDSYSLLAVNLGPRAVNITCDSACLGQLGIHSNDDIYAIYDVWTNATSAMRPSAGWTAANVQPTGVVMVVLHRHTVLLE
jgi:alpha-galactosidase